MKISKHQLAEKSILVVGDSMLDEYWYGDTTRISPEAPVPVVRIQKTEQRLGGAANVAANVSSIGCSSSLLTVLGDDIRGKELTELLVNNNVKPLCLMDGTIKTIEKLRIVARNQQLLRVDFEKLPDKEVLKSALKTFRKQIENVSAVILSDYGKGGLTHIKDMIKIANSFNKPVFVDPKGLDYERYRGATVITPNTSELAQVVGSWNSERELAAKAESLRQLLGLKYLLLTRGSEGVTLFKEGEYISTPADAREVYDVSGAGDTVIAVLASFVAAGLSMEEATVLANKAGGIVVGKFGTSKVSYEELIGNVL